LIFLATDYGCEGWKLREFDSAGAAIEAVKKGDTYGNTWKILQEIPVQPIEVSKCSHMEAVEVIDGGGGLPYCLSGLPCVSATQWYLVMTKPKPLKTDSKCSHFLYEHCLATQSADHSQIVQRCDTAAKYCVKNREQKK
jgi:hypothetical protein